jgi:hypothetical protein
MGRPKFLIWAGKPTDWNSYRIPEEVLGDFRHSAQVGCNPFLQHTFGSIFQKIILPSPLDHPIAALYENKVVSVLSQLSTRCENRGSIAPPVLTSARGGFECSNLFPRPLYIRSRTYDTHCMDDWLAPSPFCTLWNREKSLVPYGNLTPVVQSVVSRYTN